MSTASDMTVNERLAARGLFEDWERAVRAGDRATMVLLLRRIGIPNAPRVADIVLADPAFYGVGAV
ncbi:hypothetical protein EWE75_04160 [Sphingomonas populi]|uniref:Uncharacterized protein n=1 Tax=Sphingomonas populi TaxID=2484750 RepID=A0A4Q6Y785_9SPHN|nr:hypothetical protein [Sphingomonas populi]RZF65854.1 hypothetical protein EWE75_04160 [Sphingomonas populi]